MGARQVVEVPFRPPYTEPSLGMRRRDRSWLWRSHPMPEFGRGGGLGEAPGSGSGCCGDAAGRGCRRCGDPGATISMTL
ncbi:hypothetical protein AOLI_G00019150 [Acnodon oligacanthus]